jgi:hypothetical protein
MKNIFDLKDTKDLPFELVAELKTNEGVSNVFEYNLLKLFEDAGRELNIDEVTVSYYRKYKVYKKRSSILMKLYQMSKRDLSKIVPVPYKKGVYKLKK